MDLQGQLLPSDLVWVPGFRECGEGHGRGAERRGRASGLEAGRGVVRSGPGAGLLRRVPADTQRGPSQTWP